MQFVPSVLSCARVIESRGSVGADEGDCVSITVGEAVRTTEGVENVGVCEGNRVGLREGDCMGEIEGEKEGKRVGEREGECVGDRVGEAVGVYLGVSVGVCEGLSVGKSREVKGAPLGDSVGVYV